ncbi:MAG: hypothetical protein JXR73_16480 [Candidatus Omnitrophica bacterium]|nr:hypothetical protein [Candidatus Omnitrophota bacterium]
MRAKPMQLLIAVLLLGCVIGIGSGEVWAQASETPTETPVETPTETPTVAPPTATPIPPTNTPVPPTSTPTESESPVETPTATPFETPTEIPTEVPTEIPTEVPTESPVETPTDTPVPPTPTPTQEPPTPTPIETPTATPVETAVETPTPTETEVATPTPVPEKVSLTLSGPASVNVGDSVTIAVEAANAVDVDAFGLDILQSDAILDYVAVDAAGTLTADFLNVSGRALADPAGAVRVGAIGGPSVVNGDGILFNIQYTAASSGQTTLSLTNILDDLSGAEIAALTITVEETAVETPTPTETEVVTPTPVPPTATPEPTEPTATPTALEINPALGIVSIDELGGTYPRGNGVHNFDIGISDKQSGKLIAPGVLDGQIDPDALGPFLFVNGVPIPIAKDVEFTGQIAEGGNGSEGVYFLIGGSIGSYPPVSGRLGATGGPNRGGIDFDGNPDNNINFGTFKSDIIPVLFLATEVNQEGAFFSPLVDLEPAGNGGFYVISEDGAIYAEGDALESLEGASVTLSPRSKAVDLQIWRSREITLDNSQFSTDLIGTGAYILDSAGAIHVVGDAPALNTENLPVIPADSGTGSIQDIELIPNQDGTEWIGLGVLMGDGLISFAPFADVEVTDEINEYIQYLNPFGNLDTGFPIDIARDFEISISDDPVYGIDENGATVERNGRRIGIMMFDGFGGTHTGGKATRFAPAFLTKGIVILDRPVYNIDGANAIAVPINPPYTFNIDVTRDVEIAPPVKR